MFRFRFAVLAVSFLGLVGIAAEFPAVVTDAEGKEVKLPAARLTIGTRRLGWLADPKSATPDGKLGPIAMEFREPHSTAFQSGVVTLVPVSALESVKYDAAKQTAAVKVAGVAEPLAGSTAFKGVNALGLETGEPKAATKYLGGSAKGGLQAVAFPEAKPLDRKPIGGPAWQITIDHTKANNPTLTVTGLRFLVASGKSESLLATLPAKKGMPLDLTTAPRFEVLAVDATRKLAVVEVAKDDIRVLSLAPEIDGKPGALVGLLGEVPAGWKLFPLHTVLKAEKAKE